MIAIQHGPFAARIKSFGAELTSLTKDGQEFMWQAGSAWPKSAPVLFPIVGQLAGNQYVHHGLFFKLPRHGFARDREFAVEAAEADHASFTLTADAATKAVYPFNFVLALTYTLGDDGLTVRYRVTNPGSSPLPFSLGAHPAFAWHEPREGQVLVFDQPEPAPIRRLTDNLLGPETYPTPISGHSLILTDDLFVDDAMILDQVASRCVQFGQLRMEWCHDFPLLGLWSKPGAGFLCIEPWAGIADPIGFDGEISEKPGIMLLEPGQSREFWWRVGVA